MRGLSKRQKEYLSNHAPDVSKTHRYNIAHSIKLKIQEFDYFLIELLQYPISHEFNESLKRVKNTMRDIK